MELIEVETISNDLIKPATPTPPQLKFYKLSLLDQLLSVLEYRTPLVHFYAAPRNKSNANDIVDRLKHSLSNTLTLFYPLAGRLIVPEPTIECNDEGVPFVIARVKSSLSAFLRDVNRVDLVPRLVPSHEVDDPYTTAKGLVPMAIQINVFDCGAIAIGSHALHKILDGISRNHFFRTWAALSAGRHDDIVAPDLMSVLSVFPPRPNIVLPREPIVLRPLNDTSNNNMSYEDGGCVVKSFNFSARNIAALQSMARSESILNPSRIESVTCFIWKHLMAAAAKVDSSKSNISAKEWSDGYTDVSPSTLTHSVNMRPHLQPPLPPTTFGKFTTHAFVYCNKPNPELPDLVALLRRELSKVKDTQFLSKFQGVRAEEAIVQHKQMLVNIQNGSGKNSYLFASWAGFDVDFGLGKPVWIGFTGGRPSSFFKNFIPLINDPSFGLEAWPILDERQMSVLESDIEFLAFASPSTSLPSPPYSSL